MLLGQAVDASLSGPVPRHRLCRRRYRALSAPYTPLPLITEGGSLESPRKTITVSRLFQKHENETSTTL